MGFFMILISMLISVSVGIRLPWLLVFKAGGSSWISVGLRIRLGLRLMVSARPLFLPMMCLITILI